MRATPPGTWSGPLVPIACWPRISPPTPPEPALDLACGEGRNALWLAEQGLGMVSARDFSDVAIEKARQIADRRRLSVDWAVSDVSEDVIPERAYDLVCVLYLHTDSEERNQWPPEGDRRREARGHLLIHWP